MLTGISNPFGTQLQTAAVFITAGLLAGRKFGWAAGCKLASKIESYIDEQKAAKLDQAGDQYFTIAKKDAMRDFAAVTGLVAAIGLAKCAKDSYSAKEPQNEEGYFQNYATQIKYGAGAVVTGLGLVGLRSLLKFCLDTTAADNLHRKCKQWNGKAIEMGKLNLPIQFVTRVTMKTMEVLNNHFWG